MKILMCEEERTLKKISIIPTLMHGGGKLLVWKEFHLLY